MSERSRKIEGRLVALVIWLIPLAAVVAGAHRWLPRMASEHGAGIDRMLHYLLITVGGLFVAGHVVLGYFLWRFSGPRRAAFRLPNARTERKWSLVPVILLSLIAEGGVFVIGLPVWAKLYASDAPADAVVVEVTAEQFAWNIRYPGADGKFGRTSIHLLSLSNTLGLDRQDAAARDDIVLLGEIYVVVNRPARIRLRSKDVLHSFFLPHQRIKQDIVPGMTIDAGFVPTETGTYEIACAELCGFGHYQMRGLVHVVSEDEFNQWLREQPPYF
ncbi:MAG: cytochrome c oxidase subunit II [Acidobacteria bacterium]|nr:cytochrome c oxidase subunit II [Acidobacteriota bacterium]